MSWIFDYTKSEGTVLPFRVPSVLARLVCRVSGKSWDCAPGKEGYL